MKKIFSVLMTVILVLSMIPVGLAQNDLDSARSECDQRGDEWTFWESNNSSKYACVTQENYEKYAECKTKVMFEENPDWDACVKRCLDEKTGGNYQPGYPPHQTAFNECTSLCREKHPGKDPEEVCGGLLFGQEIPEEKPKEQCKQVTEDTAKFDDQWFYPECKDEFVLIQYVCVDQKTEPQPKEHDCRTEAYGENKYYKSCSQSEWQRASCSKEKPVNPTRSLEQLEDEYLKVKADDNNLNLFMLSLSGDEWNILEDNGIDLSDLYKSLSKVSEYKDMISNQLDEWKKDIEKSLEMQISGGMLPSDVDVFSRIKERLENYLKNAQGLEEWNYRMINSAYNNFIDVNKFGIREGKSELIKQIGIKYLGKAREKNMKNNSTL